jgi:two-component system, NtrC family, response regulator
MMDKGVALNKILIVDDIEDIRKQLKWGLGREYSVILAADGTEALAMFRRHQPLVVTLDLGLPPDEEGTTEGFRCLQEMLQIAPATKIIVITGNNDRENALKAVQMGAYDHYTKPVDLDELKVIISRAFHLQTIEAENRRLQNSLMERAGENNGIIGQCPAMQQVFTTIRKVAQSDVSVMVSGESGTGKELVARAIHDMSLRKHGPFIAINCGAIPDTLLESELFGHEKGSFTGAHVRVLGKVEYAHRGTLFLDEIGEIPGVLQVKLLRFLQEKKLQRVGGREDISVDVRIIAATNIDITKAMEDGRFREDLYYRIGVVTIELPPLRSRGEDIFLLANLFLKKFSSDCNKKVRGYTPEAEQCISSYSWPGNVRELENKIQRAVLMVTGHQIESDDLGFAAQPPALPVIPDVQEFGTLKDAREALEREMILSAIRTQGGNIAKAADILGVSRPTLYDLMKKHGI